MRMKVNNKNCISVMIIGCFVMLFGSCSSDPNHPGYEYMPDMYHTIAFKTYEENTNFADSSNALLPPEGTIAIGHLPYAHEKTEEGYLASASISNPTTLNEVNLKEGKRLYMIYCSPCHGEKGAGDGLVVEKGGYAMPPSYTDINAAMTKHNVKEMAAGQIYHIIMHGSTTMGSYASQLDEKQRWLIVHFVQTLQGPKEETKVVEVASGEEDERVNNES